MHHPPHVPLRRRLVGFPPAGFWCTSWWGCACGASAFCGRVLRARFAGVFLRVSVCFSVFVFIFMLDQMLIFRAFLCLPWRSSSNSGLQSSNSEFARCAVFAFQRSKWWHELFLCLLRASCDRARQLFESCEHSSSAMLFCSTDGVQCYFLGAQWRLEQCASLFFLLLKASCDQTPQLFRSCVLALTECFSVSCSEAKQLFESCRHPLSALFSVCMQRC